MTSYVLAPAPDLLIWSVIAGVVMIANLVLAGGVLYILYRVFR